MQTTIIDQREEIERMLNSLPEESLNEVLKFLEYLNFKRNQPETEPYKIVDTFEGIWQDHPITEEEFANLRQEMWGNQNHCSNGTLF